VFGRNRRRAVPAVQPAAVTMAPVGTIAPPQPASGYTTGWAPLPVHSASDQIGAYAGTQLTMRAGNVAEVQRIQGVEGLSSGWYVPARLSSSTGYQITMRAGNAAEVQRINGGSNGQLGPITARTMRANVTAQAVRQSGLSAVQWAQSLSSVAGS
jgi:hypothetical protein